MFNKSKFYTTPYSSDEVKNLLVELLRAKTKILFFSTRTLFGSVNGEDFNISDSKHSGFLTPKIKGQIISENRTLVKLKFSFPALYLIFFVGIPALVMAQIVPLIVSTDVMTINGVLREPTLLERIGFSMLCIVFPSVMIYFISVNPLRTLRRKLVEKLKLSETQR